MKYINLINNRAAEIIPEADSRFPGVAIEQRYSADFLAACIKVANNATVSLGMEYRDGVFVTATPVPELETPIESSTAETLMLAIAELAEALLTGGAK